MKVAKTSRQSKMDKIIAKIAKEELFLETLETRRSGEDFHEHAVWCIKEALVKAYQAGLEAGKNSK
jgi:phosphopantetheinyl transferase (holo-ACP synthase)